MSALVSQTVKYTDQAEGGVITHGVEEGPAGGAQTTGAFPRGGLQSRTARDELVAEKMQHLEKAKAAGRPGYSPFGQIQATDADFEWLRKKRETEAYANLDAWIGANFHKADVATRKWLQETFPEYYEARERLMVDRAKLALRIKLLKLRGPKNHKDLVLQWGLQTGRIKLDEHWDTIGYFEEPGQFSQPKQQQRFKDGLFALRRYLTQDQRTANSTANNNPFAPRGASAQSMAQFQPDAQAFPGNSITDPGRFPAFLTNVISPYTN